MAPKPKMVGHWSPPGRRPVTLVGRRTHIPKYISIDNVETIPDTILSLGEKIAPSSTLSNGTYFMHVPFLVVKLSHKEKKWSATGMFTLL